jgi:hypothetical protein
MIPSLEPAPCAVRAAGVLCLNLPACSPDQEAIAERFALSIKPPCLNKVVSPGGLHLHRAIAQLVEY